MRQLPMFVSSAIAISLASCATRLEPVQACQVVADKAGVTLGAPSRSELLTEAWTLTHFWDAMADRGEIECSVRDGRVIYFAVGGQEILRRR